MAIFHLTTSVQWDAARVSGTLAPPSLASEGFVHCSTLEQLAGTIERHFAGVDELLLLRLDEAEVRGDLRWEESRPGERFPHLYRAIALADVVEIVPWERGGPLP